MKETGISKRWIASLFCVFVSLFCFVANLSAASGKEGGETLTVGIRAPLRQRQGIMLPFSL